MEGAATRPLDSGLGELKDPGGEPLDRILERDQGQPLDLTRFLRTAIGLAKTLGQVHQHGLIHKDIKPANVFVDDTGNAWLTGFGIASQLPHEHQSPEAPEFIAGTLGSSTYDSKARMFIPRCAKARKHLPRAPGLSSIRYGKLPGLRHPSWLLFSQNWQTGGRDTAGRISHAGQKFSCKSLRILSQDLAFKSVVRSHTRNRFTGWPRRGISFWRR